MMKIIARLYKLRYRREYNEMKDLNELQLCNRINRSLLFLGAQMKSPRKYILTLKIVEIVMKERNITSQDLLDAYAADTVMRELTEESLPSRPKFKPIGHRHIGHAPPRPLYMPTTNTKDKEFRELFFPEGQSAKTKK